MNITFINRLMAIKFGGGESFDLNIARAMKRRGHKIRFVVGREWRKISLPLAEKEFDEIIYIKTPYLRDIHYRVQPTNLLKKSISAGALELDLWVFENAVLKRLQNDDWSDVYQLCALPRLGALLGKRRRETQRKFKTAVWWPGPPSRRKLKYMQGCDINFAHGDTMITLKKLIPHSYDISPGVDTHLFKPIKKKNDKITFVFVGRIIPVKRIDFLIKAFCEAVKSYNNIQLLIVGEGTGSKHLLSMGGSHIDFVGPKYRQELYDILGKSDVFCITSQYESFSIATLEAMACGLPVIASHVGFLPKLITSNGILVELDNTEQLKKAILKLSKNRALRETMGKAGRERVKREFTWHKSAIQLEKIYASA